MDVVFADNWQVEKIISIWQHYTDGVISLPFDVEASKHF